MQFWSSRHVTSAQWYDSDHRRLETRENLNRVRILPRARATSGHVTSWSMSLQRQRSQMLTFATKKLSSDTKGQLEKEDTASFSSSCPRSFDWLEAVAGSDNGHRDGNTPCHEQMTRQRPSLTRTVTICRVDELDRVPRPAQLTVITTMLSQHFKFKLGRSTIPWHWHKVESRQTWPWHGRVTVG